MINRFSRTELLLGKKNMDKLSLSRVAIFGIGGVGGYVCEALARSGIKEFDLIDKDVVSITNINRQIIATTKTVGLDKVKVMKERMLDINPNIKVNVHKCFFLPENADTFNFDKYDYVVDAVDTVAAKIALAMKCKETDTPIISSMGAGNKLNPVAFEVADLFKTEMDPLAKVMRRELKKRGIKKLKVVYSKEQPIVTDYDITQNCQEEEIEHSGNNNVVRRRAFPGSIAFVPSVVGLIIAGEVIKDICEIK